MTCPECQKPSEIMHELTPDQEAAKTIEAERERQLSARDKKEREANPQTAAEKAFAEKVDRVNMEEAPKHPKAARPVSFYWKLLAESRAENQQGESGDILYAMDVNGGIVLRSVLVGNDKFSQAMVFLPGFEIIGDGIIRKP